MMYLVIVWGTRVTQFSGKITLWLCLFIVLCIR